jgi:Ser/Thr protein kinase RdoA (MazF antagonist)
MHILAQRPNSLVIINDSDAIEKFYRQKRHWEQEAANLRFLADAQEHGLTIGCPIPKLIASDTMGSSTSHAEHPYRNTMQRLHGTQADQRPASTEAAWATNLATVIFNMHTALQPYIADWTRKFGEQDALLKHILEDKAASILEQTSDAHIRRGVEQAAKYLKQHMPRYASQRTLSYQDLNLSNILVDERNHITGIVDWVTFGLTHPGLTLYQLAARPHIWEPFQKQYINLGGTIQDDILYAAALIHVAWSITIWAPLVAGTEHELDVDETLQRFHSIYRNAVEVCGFR